MTEEMLTLMFGVSIALVVVGGLAEFIVFYKRKTKADLREYNMIVTGLVVTGLIALLLKPAAIGVWALMGSSFSPIELIAFEDWYLWPLALIIYEFFYWLQHWAGHKVRLFWCVHAPHHVPNSMSMFVGYNHSFIESLFYMPITLGFFAGLCGVDPLLVITINILDTFWGSYLHLSEDTVKRRYGFLEKFMQTPSYHRVHHGQNLEYMDTNYNSITLFWDTVMGTKVVLDDANPVVYGITSEVDPGNYIDSHYGQFKKLWLDVRAAPNLMAKIAYVFMPPGWSHTGEHRTVSSQKQAAHQLGLSNG